MKKLLFVSHPSSADIEGNYKKVMRICKYWWKRGYIPIAPHLLFSYMESDRDRAIIMRVCYFLIMMCPTFLSYGDTAGCKEEIEFAHKMGKHIKIMYERVDYKEMMEDAHSIDMRGE